MWQIICIFRFDHGTKFIDLNSVKSAPPAGFHKIPELVVPSVSQTFRNGINIRDHAQTSVVSTDNFTIGRETNSQSTLFVTGPHEEIACILATIAHPFVALSAQLVQ